MLLLTEQLRGDREPPELSEARSKIVFQRLLLPLFLQNQSNHLQRGDGKVGCFRVWEIRHFKRRMIKMKGGNSNINGCIKEKNQELNPGGFQQANAGKPFSYAAPLIELLAALGDVVHSLCSFSYKGVYDPHILPRFLNSPGSGLSRENSSSCMVCCDGDSFKIYASQQASVCRASSDSGENSQLQGNSES